jgi:hypothetical protein
MEHVKNNLKKLLKVGIILFGLAILIHSCQKDDASEIIESSDEIQNILSQKISINDIPNANQVSDVLRNLSSNFNSNGLQRTLNPDSVSINTDDILYMEYADTHTLTFKLLSNNPEFYIENIVLHYNVETESYDEYLVQYELSGDEFVDIHNGQPLTESATSLITKLDNGTFTGLSNRGSGFCTQNCQTFYFNCTAGANHEYGEVEECNGDADQLPFFVEICSTPTCYDTNPTTTIDAGPSSSGGGGGNNDDIITNPNTNEPCQTVKGKVGITGNDGCISTADDRARDELFDRLATVLTNQEQADWIVLEANIEVVNALNNYLDEASYYNQTEYKNKAVDFIDIFLTIPNMSWTLIEDWFINTPNFTEIDLNINPDNITYEESLTQQDLPSLDDFVDNFPKLGTSGNYSEMSTSEVYTLVGGSLLTSHQNQPESYSNACSIRGSRGLLYSGIDIPVLNYPNVGQRTQKGGDNENYILDAVSFDKFMKDKFGDATYELTGADANDPVQVANLLNGKNGIYVIINNDGSLNGAGYSGHVDAIINGDCISNAYTTPQGGVKSIRIWELN